MNKITFFLLFLISFAVNAQFSLETSIGRIENGEVITTRTLEEKGSDLRFSIINDTDEAIAVRLKIVALENTDGRDFELCFGGDCHQQIREGAVYPQNEEGYYLIPSQGIFDKGLNRLWNRKEEGEIPEDYLGYKFEFEQIDTRTSAVIRSLQFTYKYEHPEKTEETKQEVQVHLPRTVIRNGSLSLEAGEPLTFQIFNLIGREVKHQRVQSGQYRIDISDLSSQIYIVRFQNRQGLVKTQKIVVD